MFGCEGRGDWRIPSPPSGNCKTAIYLLILRSPAAKPGVSKDEARESVASWFEKAARSQAYAACLCHGGLLTMRSEDASVSKNEPAEVGVPGEVADVLVHIGSVDADRIAMAIRRDE